MLRRRTNTEGWLRLLLEAGLPAVLGGGCSRLPFDRAGDRDFVEDDSTKLPGELTPRADGEESPSTARVVGVGEAAHAGDGGLGATTVYLWVCADLC